MRDFGVRLEEIRGRMDLAARRSGRDPSGVALVAVSKTQPAEAVRGLYEAGQRVFGENRVQELLAKAPLLPGSVRWHLVGHLQRNKIRKVLPAVELIHGVDSLELARDIDRIAAELGMFPRVLLEVNVAGERTKFGFTPEGVRSALDELLGLSRVQVEGLMAIPPAAEKPEEARPYFAALRRLREELADRSGAPLSTLSMGMSGDFEEAIAEGATLVRVGTALLGPRSGPG